MKIDIQPNIEKASDLDSICIDARCIDALYVVRLADGSDYTTKFDNKSLEEFQTNKTVSEMLASWEENIILRYNTAMEAVKTRIHPTRTFEREIMREIGHGHEIGTGKFETLVKEIDKVAPKLKDKITIQIGSGSYIPKNCKWFRF